MPELPEVETTRLHLAPVLTGRRLDAVSILDPRLSAPVAPAELAGELTGERVRNVGRRGKYLVFDLSSGRHLLVHLRMTGGFRLGENGTGATDPHLRAVVSLDDGSDVLYRDVRRFGTWLLLEEAELEPYLEQRLGPEPLERRFTATRLRAVLTRRRAPIKSVLLDQRAVAGVGNIYADEALWRARVHPLRPAADLADAEVRSLHGALRAVLRVGLARQGATLRDYRDPAGNAGSMQEELKVYGRVGEPCPRCGTPIARVRVAGRSSCFCAACQLGPAAAARLRNAG